jgi:hypothetical protein
MSPFELVQAIQSASVDVVGLDSRRPVVVLRSVDDQDVGEMAVIRFRCISHWIEKIGGSHEGKWNVIQWLPPRSHVSVLTMNVRGLTLTWAGNSFTFWIRLTLLEITSLWTYTLSYLLHSRRTYTLNKVISLGLQTLNPQQNYFPLKTQTSDYHYQETTKRHTNICRNSVTLTKHDKNDHILHETRVEILPVIAI